MLNLYLCIILPDLKTDIFMRPEADASEALHSVCDVLWKGGIDMNKDSRNTEELRSRLLSDVYAGSCAGMPAMMLDESRIKNADADELERIAEEYGY